MGTLSIHLYKKIQLCRTMKMEMRTSKNAMVYMLVCDTMVIWKSYLDDTARIFSPIKSFAHKIHVIIQRKMLILISSYHACILHAFIRDHT